MAHAFMWMYATELQDGTVVQAYKHADTRRYLFLAADLTAYAYTSSGGYTRMPLNDAIANVHATGLLYGYFDRDEVDAIRVAVDRARELATGA